MLRPAQPDINGQALYDEAYENYRNFVNPPLARVMKVSGSPVEMRAQGSTIWDHNGKAYLDFAGGYGVFTLGHSHPKVIAAVKEQMDLMSLSGKTMFNVMLGRASRRLAELTPGDLRISFFANSGTEAVEGAIKLARAATHRRKIVGTRNAYHGKTIGALSASVRCATQLHSSWSRCKVKAALMYRRAAICARCARSAIAQERSSSPMRCRPVSGAAACSSVAIATASFRT
jgi:4-aminobutyrate aminotransferase-like enzyme